MTEKIQRLAVLADRKVRKYSRKIRKMKARFYQRMVFYHAKTIGAAPVVAMFL